MHFMLGGRFGVTKRGTEDDLHAQQIKTRQQIGMEDSVQAVCRRMRRLEGFLDEAAKNFV
jgi:hypothetical protein